MVTGSSNSGMKSEKGAKASKNMNSRMKNPVENPSVGGSSAQKKPSGQHNNSTNNNGKCGAQFFLKEKRLIKYIKK